MKKETLADKLARKTFQSRAFQKSWNIHVQAFGPILEPAFTGDYQARVHLTAALNLLSQQKLVEALQKLQALQEKVHQDTRQAQHQHLLGKGAQSRAVSPFAPQGLPDSAAVAAPRNSHRPHRQLFAQGTDDFFLLRGKIIKKNNSFHSRASFVFSL